jgi:hypothetical protein
MVMTDRDALSSPLSRIQRSLKLWLQVAVLVPTLITVSPLAIAGFAQEPPLSISQRTASWDGQLRMARLLNRDQAVTALVVQLDILNKPETTYANAVYQVYAQLDGQWTAVYTNAGARLINARSGGMALPPEVILLSQMQRSMSQAAYRGYRAL